MTDQKMKKCLTEANLDVDRLWGCADGSEGRKLLAEVGKMTKKLHPRLTFVPWVVINGKYESMAYKNLKPLICGKYYHGC